MRWLGAAAMLLLAAGLARAEERTIYLERSPR